MLFATSSISSLRCRFAGSETSCSSPSESGPIDSVCDLRPSSSDHLTRITGGPVRSVLLCFLFEFFVILSQEVRERQQALTLFVSWLCWSCSIFFKSLSRSFFSSSGLAALFPAEVRDEGLPEEGWAEDRWAASLGWVSFLVRSLVFIIVLIFN